MEIVYRSLLIRSSNYLLLRVMIVPKHGKTKIYCRFFAQSARWGSNLPLRIIKLNIIPITAREDMQCIAQIVDNTRGG